MKSPIRAAAPDIVARGAHSPAKNISGKNSTCRPRRRPAGARRHGGDQQADRRAAPRRPARTRATKPSGCRGSGTPKAIRASRTITQRGRPRSRRGWSTSCAPSTAGRPHRRGGEPAQDAALPVGGQRRGQRAEAQRGEREADQHRHVGLHERDPAEVRVGAAAGERRTRPAARAGTRSPQNSSSGSRRSSRVSDFSESGRTASCGHLRSARRTRRRGWPARAAGRRRRSRRGPARR